MNILAGKYTETENNGVKTISTKGIDFVGTNLLTSAIGNAYNLLNGDRIAEKFEFDGMREFYRFSGNYFIVKYSDKLLRDSDKQDLTSKGEFNKFGKAEKDSDGFQIPMTDFVVDYDGSYYLMIEGTKKLDEELTDVNKGVFKSMVVDLSKFNSIGEGVQEEVKSVEDKVSNLL